MKIQIIGKNSSNRIKLIKNLEKSLKRKNLFTKIELLEDEKNIKNLNISNPPALIINDKVISQGKVLSEREIGKFIEILV